jgi:hypothetical protein
MMTLTRRGSPFAIDPPGEGLLKTENFSAGRAMVDQVLCGARRVYGSDG